MSVCYQGESVKAALVWACYTLTLSHEQVHRDIGSLLHQDSAQVHLLQICRAAELTDSQMSRREWSPEECSRDEHTHKHPTQTETHRRKQKQAHSFIR